MGKHKKKMDEPFFFRETEERETWLVLKGQTRRLGNQENGMEKICFIDMDRHYATLGECP